MDFDYDISSFDDIKKDFDDVFTPKKKYSLKYASVLERLGTGYEKRCARVRSCATYFEYGVYSDKSVKFHSANFCKDILCPQCAKRKSLKLFREVYNCVQYLSATGKYNFLFITLTVKDVVSQDLNSTCDYLNSCCVNLLRRKRISSFVLGSFRALEVTHDNQQYITHDMFFGNKKRHMKNKSKYYGQLGLKVGDLNPHFDYYHPHLHMIWIVDNSYFKSPDFLKQSELCTLWKDTLFVDYTPICDIRLCVDKNQSVFSHNKKDVSIKNLVSAVAEVAKYSVKGSDFLTGSDEVNENTVKCLLSTFENRRMFVFTGLFRTVREMLSEGAKNGLFICDDAILSIPPRAVPVLVGKLCFSWVDSRSFYVSSYHRLCPSSADIEIVDLSKHVS